jgi:predicted 3-demethylubiquinone-9 3-methyltransferase (glyoxalase superfamily)
MARSFATHLLFDGQAEAAMSFYIALFEGSQILHCERYAAGEAGAPGSIKVATFRLGTQTFSCADSPAKHAFGFTPAVSLFVECESERELEHSFERLSNPGEILMPLDHYGFSRRFAWVNDRFGVSWQLNLT